METNALYYGNNLEIQQKIRDLASLDIAEYVKRFGTSEENVKFHIVIPVLELLGYSRADMNFEHHVLNRRADIALLFDNKPVAIVEVKALEKDLDDYIDQAIGYAEHEGIPWVILTNGVEIRVYKSWIDYHSPKDRRLFLTTLHELPQSFEALFERVGKPSLPTARKLTEEAETKRESITAEILIKDLAGCKQRLFSELFSQFDQRYETDAKFKAAIDKWATDVKMDISDRDLIEKLCKEGAYTLINRVLFLRICEDKQHIKAKLSKDALVKWREMVENPAKLLDFAFSEIGEHFEGLYRSPLFDAIGFEDIEWSEDTINFILDRMSEYDFSKISKDILGKAYEQHITREERKQLGQFYTPDVVIDYILDNTLGQVLREKPLEQIKILDPACGSGGFLMRAYDRLREEYLRQGWAERKVHEQILKKNLYGIDINPFATQLTVMNLLLKDLEHPANQVNVMTGDSLEKLELAFDLDIYEQEHPLTFIRQPEDVKVSLSRLLKNRPFDIVVSNPPYIFTRSTFISRSEKEYYAKHYKSAAGKVNTFAIFLESGIERLCEKGRLGMIVPNTLLRVSTYEPIRNYILDNCAIEQIVDLGGGQFDEVTAETIIIILCREADRPTRTSNKTRVLTEAKSLPSADYKVSHIKQSTFELNPRRSFNIFVDEGANAILSTIERECIPFGKTAQDIIAGVATPKGKRNFISDRRLDERYKPLLEGKDIDRYSIQFASKYVLYDRGLLHRPRPESIFLSPIKILIRRIGGGSYPIVATLDTNQYYTFNSLNNAILHTAQFDDKYVLALLNSKVLNYYFTMRCTNRAGLTVNISKGYLERLPIKPASSERQSELASLVDRMLNLNRQITSATTRLKDDLQKQIDATDLEIDQEVYNLYGITEEEKQIIEACFASGSPSQGKKRLKHNTQ